MKFDDIKIFLISWIFRWCSIKVLFDVLHSMLLSKLKQSNQRKQNCEQKETGEKGKGKGNGICVGIDLGTTYR